MLPDSRDAMVPAGLVLNQPRLAREFSRTAGHLLRYGLVLLILWIGVFKFTPTEAKAIEPLLANSPLLSWLLAVPA